MQSERQPAGATAPNDTRTRVKYVRRLGQVTQLTPEQRDRLGPVEARYVFRANDYYLGLIDWDDPEDPIRQLIIPREEELSEWGTLDASNEESVTVARGVQHKYTDTVLLLCNEVCGAYCRYCFRKRLFMDDNDEVTHDITEGLRYIADHPEVTNVLLTGGDPLLMSTRRLVEIFEALRGDSARADHPARVQDASVRPLPGAQRSGPAGGVPHVLDTPAAALPDGPLRPPAGADRRGDPRGRRLYSQRGDLRQPVPADQRHQRRPRRAGRDVRDPVVYRLHPVLPVPGPADGGQRAVRDPDRRGVEHFPAGADARVRAGAERALLHVARDGQGGRS